MSKLVTVAMAAVSVLALSTAFAQAGNYGGIGGTTVGGGISANPGLKIRPVVACSVSGTPQEFPDDIWISNKGPGDLAAGTKVHWSVPFANKQGDFILASALKGGKSVFLSGVLAGGVEAGKPCAASF